LTASATASAQVIMRSFLILYSFISRNGNCQDSLIGLSL
jgi:hypothetical protein